MSGRFNVFTGYEDSYFPDRGCRHSPSCLRCPLPACAYDDPSLAIARRLQALTLHERGLPTREIAAAIGVSERTVYRLLKDAPAQRRSA